MYRDDISKWKGNVEIAGYGRSFVLYYLSLRSPFSLLPFLVLLRHYGRTPRVSLHDASLALYLLPSLSFLPPTALVGILFTRRRVHDEKSRVRSYIRRETGRSIGYQRKILRIDGRELRAGRFLATVTEYNRRMPLYNSERERRSNCFPVFLVHSCRLLLPLFPPDAGVSTLANSDEYRGGPRERIAEFRRD